MEDGRFSCQLIRADKWRMISGFLYAFVCFLALSSNTFSEDSTLWKIEIFFLIFLAAIDFIYQVIPFELIAVSFFLHLFHPQFVQKLAESLAGQLLNLFILFLVYKMFAGINKFEEPAFGFGDVLFGGLIGLVFGFPTGLKGIALGLIAAGCFGLIFKALQKPRQQLIPLAPFLLSGGLISVLLLL